LKGIGWNPAIDDTLMTAPWPRANERRDVELDLVELPLPIEIREAPEGAAAGVVDQQVGRTLLDSRHDAGDAGSVGEIRRQDLDLDGSSLAKALGELLQAVGAPRHQHEVVLLARERLRKGGTDARGRAGHQSGATGPGVMRGGGGGRVAGGHGLPLAEGRLG
jgi:hypothetical protein